VSQRRGGQEEEAHHQGDEQKALNVGLPPNDGLQAAPGATIISDGVLPGRTTAFDSHGRSTHIKDGMKSVTVDVKLGPLNFKQLEAGTVLEAVRTKASEAVRLMLPSSIGVNDISVTVSPKSGDAVLMQIDINEKPDFGADAISKKMADLNPEGKQMLVVLLQRLLEGTGLAALTNKAPLKVELEDVRLQAKDSSEEKGLPFKAPSDKSPLATGSIEPWSGAGTALEPAPCAKKNLGPTLFSPAIPTTPTTTMPCAQTTAATPVVEKTTTETTETTTPAPCIKIVTAANPTTTTSPSPCEGTAPTIPPTTWKPPVVTTPCPEDLGIRPKPCDISGRNNWIIKLPDDWTDEQIRTLSAKFVSRDKYEGHPSERGLPILIVWASPEELAKAFHSTPGVQYVEQDSDINCLVESQNYEVESEDMNQRLQVPWSLDRLDSEHDMDGKYIAGGTDGGRGAHIYVMDTGIRTTHAQFGGRAVPAIETTSSQVKVCSSTDIDCASDDNGHGTHVAATAAGSTYGVAQGAWLHAVKTLTDECKGSMASFLIGVDWILTNGERPAVIAAALNGTTSGMSSRAMKDAIDKATESGVAIVVGAGDDHTSACGESPAFIPSAITVAASNEEDSMAPFSNYGSCIDLFAPGTKIKTAGIKSDMSFAVVSGTNMAVAHVAGAAAMTLSIWNSLSAPEVLNQLLRNAFADVLHFERCQSDGAPNKLLGIKTGVGLQEIIIGPSDDGPENPSATPSTEMKTSKFRKKCVKAPVGIRCPVNAGDYGQRLGHDEFKDAFKITVEGNQVCAQRVDNYEDDFLPDAKYSAGMYDEGGWLINLRILCHWKSAAASGDLWGFESLGGTDENAVCAADDPVDRKSIYTARYHNISKVETCQELCQVHQGCKGFSLLNEHRCEVWLKNIKSFVLMPKKMTFTNPVRCMRMMGRGVVGAGVIRLASHPLMCLQTIPLPIAMDGPANLIAIKECDTKNEFQQLSWEGVGAITLASSSTNCLSTIDVITGGVPSTRLTIQSCAKAIPFALTTNQSNHKQHTNRSSQMFSFMGSGLLRWVGENQDYCVTSKVSRAPKNFFNQPSLSANIYPEIAPCDKTDPDQQFFY